MISDTSSTGTSQRQGPPRRLRIGAPGALETELFTRPERYMAVIAKGDELLDWREMSARYRGSHLRIVEGSDHALSDFDEHLPHLLHFLELAPSP